MSLKEYINNSTRLTLSSVLAGVCIGLGGTVYLRLVGAFPGSNVVGALLFAIGLFTVCTRRYSLYTGRLCYILDNPPSYLLDIISIWLGNFIGCALVAWLESLTTLYGQTGINIAAADIVSKKMSAPTLSLFVLGIFCNIFMFIAVDSYNNNPHESGKYLAIFLGVSVFILSGTEHCVADMYYWCISGEIYRHPVESLARLAIISAGNLVGGLSIPVIERIANKGIWR